MRDAFGGIVNISIIVVFIVIVSGYLAFNVNYTKAFRVKNKIITNLEQYEGNCAPGSPCAGDISTYIKGIGYNTSAPNITGTGVTCVDEYGYCYQEFSTGTSDNIKHYYKVTTQINIDIPIINKIMPSLRVFQLSGNTKLIKKP